MMFVTSQTFALAREQIMDLRAELAASRAAYAALLDKYHALRLIGHDAPEQATVPRTPRAADRVTEVIADVAGSNSALRRQLHSFAKKQRAAGEDDDAIIQALFNWQGDDGGTAE